MSESSDNLSLNLKRKQYRIGAYAITRDKNYRLKKISYSVEKKPPSNRPRTERQLKNIDWIWKLHELLSHELFTLKSEVRYMFSTETVTYVSIDFETGIVIPCTNDDTPNCRLSQSKKY